MRWCPNSEFLAIFWIMHSSESRAAHFRPAFKIRTTTTPCVEISNLPPLRSGEEKKEEERKKQDESIMSASATPGGHKKKKIGR